MFGKCLGVVAVLLSSSALAISADCSAISQVTVTSVNEARILYLDLPEDATHLREFFWAQDLSVPQKQWEHCSLAANEAGACGYVHFQPVVTHDTPKLTDRIEVTVTAVAKQTSGSKYVFWPSTAVRYVLSYKVPGKTCHVQYSFAVQPGTSVVQLADLRIPPGRTISGTAVWAKNAKQDWASCGENLPQIQGGPVGKEWSYQNCLNTRYVGVEFWMTVNDPVDGAPGINTKCGASNFTEGIVTVTPLTPFWCRVRLEYKP